MESTSTLAAGRRYFLTVDAETEVLAEGIAAVNEIRERVEKESSMRIPIVWLIRFQRTWNEYIDNDSPEYFAGPISRSFDGFELGKPLLRELQRRGDEIGWHYHAYNYVHRDDLTHERKIAILRADLASCGAEIFRRHPEFEVQSFRFGWYFVPDYNLYEILAGYGIRIDASTRPDLAGQRVKKFNVYFPPAVPCLPAKIKGTWFLPAEPERLVHDFNVVAHQLGWTSQDEQAASQRRAAYETMLWSMVRECRESGASFSTYRDAFA
ncbi:MAG TPA: hypothetical protein VMT64_17010 [Candidatus Binataceae bacterium]|nr:hypothetical protein [Candidatus Binataceae bacterium]